MNRQVNLRVVTIVHLYATIVRLIAPMLNPRTCGCTAFYCRIRCIEDSVSSSRIRTTRTPVMDISPPQEGTDPLHPRLTTIHLPSQEAASPLHSGLPSSHAASLAALDLQSISTMSITSTGGVIRVPAHRPMNLPPGVGMSPMMFPWMQDRKDRLTGGCHRVTKSII